MSTFDMRNECEFLTLNEEMLHLIDGGVNWAAVGVVSLAVVGVVAIAVCPVVAVGAFYGMASLSASAAGVTAAGSAVLSVAAGATMLNTATNLAN